MLAEPENERFQELAATMFDVLKALESEVIAYRIAAASLRTSVFDEGLADAVFQLALTSARRAPDTRKAGEKFSVASARFAELLHLPLDPKSGILSEWLRAFQRQVFPSNDSPSKDAQ
jgi:hypothetical protein